MYSVITRTVSFLAIYCLSFALADVSMADVAKPVLHYGFDQPSETTVKDVAGNSDDAIEGNFKYMPGVVGTALKPDGYTTRIVRQADKTPAPKSGFTVEAWVAEAAYPWYWCPVLSQRDGEEKGFYFGLGPKGDISLELAVGGKWYKCVSESLVVPLRQWTHIAATYDPAKGITLYVNGKEAGKLEVTYIYPDQMGIRKPTWKTGTLGGPRQFQESLPFTQPGQTRGDVVGVEFVHMTNLKGERAKLMYVEDPTADGPPREFPENLVVQQFNFHSKNKPSIIFEPGSKMKYLRDRKIAPGLDVADGCCHWPVGQPACDGRELQAADRPSHFISFPVSNPPIHEKDGRSWWNGLYGMTEMDLDALTFVAKSWSYPAELTIASKGFESQGYDRSERAYKLSKEKAGSDGTLALTLAATEESPVFNPAFVIEDWAPRSLTLKLDGLTVKRGPDFRLGTRQTLGGRDTIIWLKHQSTKPVTITFEAR